MIKFESAVLNHEGVYDIDVAEVRAQLGHCRLLDVRRPDEFCGELGHIEGATLMTLESHFAEGIRAEDKEQTIVIICRSGARSSRAAAYAQALGFKSVYNMAGGMIEWNERSFPVAQD